jgi:hypothetical protein
MGGNNPYGSRLMQYANEWKNLFEYYYRAFDMDVIATYEVANRS